ncbi:MAG: response regulator [Chitinophagaceae bacterium]
MNVLIIEDNLGDFVLLDDAIRSTSLMIKEVQHASTLEEAFTILDEFKPNVIFLDLFLPDSVGLESFIQIQDEYADTPILIVSGLSDVATSIQALGLGAQDYLVKGEFNEKIIEKTIRYSLERKKAELQIILSEEKYRQIFYDNPFPMFIYDIDTLKMVECNNATLQEYGYTRDEFLQLTINDITYSVNNHIKDDTTPINSEFRKKTWRHVKKNGDIILVKITIYKVEYAGKKVHQVQVHNVTEEVRLHEQLADEQIKRQHQITEAALQAQENERIEIGRELHDNINQILVASLLFLDYALVSNEVKVDLLKKSKHLVSDAIAEIRKLSKTLIPPSVGNNELISSLEELLDTVQLTKQIHIVKYIDATIEEALSKEQKLAVYRIIQEQLNNIIKHANASEIIVNLAINNQIFSLSVNDNGKGFDVSQKSKGVGLQNITSRTSLHNGTVDFISSPNKGFELLVQFPL